MKKLTIFTSSSEASDSKYLYSSIKMSSPTRKHDFELSTMDDDNDSEE